MAENLIAVVIGAILGGFLTLIATWVNNRAAEKRLRIQLYHEDRKKVLTQLYQLSEMKYKTYPEFKKALLSFLAGLQSEFLPEGLKKAIQSKIYEVDKFQEESGLVPPEPTDEEIDKWLEEYEEYFEGLSEWERAEEEFKRRFEGLKSSIKESIREKIKEVE